jgi:hypothetical protein
LTIIAAELSGGRVRKPTVSFRAEVELRFQFLVDQYGLDGPEYSELLLQSVLYSGSGWRTWVFLHDDARDGAGTTISVMVSVDNDEGNVKADLSDLVEAAVLAPRHRVASKAHSGDAVRATLDDHAMWLRRLWPLLQEPDAFEMVRSAGRTATDRAGNPKRRPKNIKWRYDK